MSAEWPVAAWNACARELLEENLSWRQRRQLRKHRWFLVRGSEGGTYRIRRGWVRNVEEVTRWWKDHENTWCGGFSAWRGFPIEDHLLAQKLLIERDEGEFRTLANADY